LIFSNFSQFQVDYDGIGFNNDRFVGLL